MLWCIAHDLIRDASAFSIVTEAASYQIRQGLGREGAGP